LGAGLSGFCPATALGDFRYRLIWRSIVFLPEANILTRYVLICELLSNLVFEDCWSCGDLAWVCGFNSVFERDASDDFGEIVKAA